LLVVVEREGFCGFFAVVVEKHVTGSRFWALV